MGLVLQLNLLYPYRHSLIVLVHVLLFFLLQPSRWDWDGLAFSEWNVIGPTMQPLSNAGCLHRVSQLAYIFGDCKCRYMAVYYLNIYSKHTNNLGWPLKNMSGSDLALTRA